MANESLHEFHANSGRETCTTSCIFLAGLFSISPIAAHAGLGVGLSVEQFTWTEKSDSGARLLRERGLRHVANLEWLNTGTPGISYGYIGKWYMGRVDYAGRTQTGTPFATTTAYDGASHEFWLNFHSHIKQHRLDYVAGIGLDAWRRWAQVSAPTCISPQVLQNGVCITPTPTCYSPQVLQNGACVTPTLFYTGTWVGTWQWSGPTSGGCPAVDGDAFSIEFTQTGNFCFGNH